MMKVGTSFCVVTGAGALVDICMCFMQQIIAAHYMVGTRPVQPDLFLNL
jgi:hypothetical protein